MTGPVPAEPKIYHIVHVDRLASIVSDGFLWCDARIVRRDPGGTTIGMSDIKRKRLECRELTSHPGLHVGECVPFYFCPRSVMLFVIHKANHPDLEYRGGQAPIVHLEGDLHQTVDWANRHSLRWAFTLSNAGSRYFEDRCDLAALGDVNWPAVQARDWRECQGPKWSEFLVEARFPLDLVSRVGVYSASIARMVTAALKASTHSPTVEIRKDWYY